MEKIPFVVLVIFYAMISAPFFIVQSLRVSRADYVSIGVWIGSAFLAAAIFPSVGRIVRRIWKALAGEAKSN